MRITFEGDHRSGKGTQIALYREKHGPDIPVVRGDGSYQGGLEGIVDDEQLAFRRHLNVRLYTEKDRAETLWDIAATACAATVNLPQFRGSSLLVDRGPVSRAAFLLSRGITGRELIDAMYPEFTYELDDTRIEQPAIPVESVDFGRIVYIRVPTDVLLSRISSDDPKAEFRRKNIQDKEGLFDAAVDVLPRSVREMVEVIDGHQPPEVVLKNYDSR